MTLADGAWRESFLMVKSPRAAVTFSRKQTHMISAASFSVAVAASAVAAAMPRLVKKSAIITAAQSSRRPRPGVQTTVGLGFAASISAAPCLVAPSFDFSAARTRVEPRSSTTSKTV